MVTSALRETPNGNKVIHKIEEMIVQGVTVLSGTDEARLTFLAARRWYGWDAGRLLVLDIGGGSLEVAMGSDEEPTVALPGITPERTMQIVGGGVVADEIMKALNIQEVEICPWVLREGAILRWLDQFGRARLGF